jgi:hypothetical protein
MKAGMPASSIVLVRLGDYWQEGRTRDNPERGEASECNAR